jgi:hypothetical protein
MNTEVKIRTRRASQTGILLLALSWLASCAPEHDAATTNDQDHASTAGATAKPSLRRAKEGTGHALGAADEQSPAGDAHSAGDEPAADPTGDPSLDDARAIADMEVGHCTTPDVVGEPPPVVEEVPVELPQPEGMPPQVPTSDEVREHLVAAPDMPAPNAATMAAQVQYLQEADAIEQAMGNAAPEELEARLAQRKAELIK